MNSLKIPGHVAFIMDGNGRWAREKGFDRTAGHREGIARMKEVIRAASEMGIKTVTFFAFSTENWNRPKKEVSMLMRYLDNFLGREVAQLHKKNMRFTVIGRKEPIPGFLQKKIEKCQEKTKNNTGLRVVLALNYGGRQEIIDAAREFAREAIEGKASLKDLDEKKFSSYLYAPDLGDPDLLIRTSNELRISNFLLWQLSYSEYYFSPKYWPDSKEEDLKEAIKEYQRRQRRFGGVDAH